jgi:iron(III) transport system ATP-binding protein
VALARALCAEPAVLLLDEPLASLDPAVRRDVRAALLEARAASGAAMVLVTHDLDDAMAVATNIATIHDGSITTPASPQAMLAAPPDLATARLLGVFSEVRGTVVQTASGAEFQWLGGVLMPGDVVAGAAVAGAVVACVRAHDVHVCAADRLEHGVLTVLARRDAAHDVSLTLRDANDATVQLRVALGTLADIGDAVHVRLVNARLFPIA